MYKNILVPIDVSHPERHEVAMKMARLLSDEGAKITTIAVVEPIPAYVGISGMVPEFDSQVKASVTESLASFAEGQDVDNVVLHGSPGTEIVEYAKEKDVDCIVIHSHKPGFGDFLLGSTAARVVRHATCCVHVMR
ncbi:MAG: universal stress protein [Silicimonas sp.]|nr:universal stress protein [Silicimonas sp.]